MDLKNKAGLGKKFAAAGGCGGQNQHIEIIAGRGIRPASGISRSHPLP